ncbi:hypothetical protein [Variovorax sp. KK3]|nr:hypothetical protein [Variovorax sp. KK3]
MEQLRMERCRGRLLLFSFAAGLAACTTAQVPHERSSFGVSGTAPIPLTPQPDGSPLPPRDARAADRWPSEFKRFIDEAIELFKPGSREPTLQEFEAKLGIKVLPSDWKKKDDDSRMQVYRVEAPWIYRPEPTDPPFWAQLNTLTELQRPSPGSSTAGQRIYRLAFKMDPSMVPCIDAYDLAIYTGANFSNSDASPHQSPRPIWSEAYEWGMFKRGHTGRYTSNKRFSLTVSVANSGDSPPRGATCVATFGISANFIPN